MWTTTRTSTRWTEPEAVLREALVKVAFWIPLGVCTAVAFTANPTGIAADLSGMFAHAAAFTYLAIALCVAHFRTGSVLAAAVWMLAFGVAIEVGQTFIPGRGGELLDVAIDAVGILVGCLAYRILAFLSMSHFDSRTRP